MKLLKVLGLVVALDCFGAISTVNAASFIEEKNCAQQGNVEFKDSVAALKEEYAVMFKLCAEIKMLEARLVEDLSQEERLEIETRLVEIKEVYDTMKLEFDAKMAELRETFDALEGENQKGSGCKNNQDGCGKGRGGNGCGKNAGNEKRVRKYKNRK